MNFPEHLTGLRNLSKTDIDDIFELTGIFKKKIISKEPLEKVLGGKSVINMFFENSTRTRTSFEFAEKKLGMDVVNFNESGSSLSKGESFTDTLKNIEAMKFDFAVVRHPDSGIITVFRDLTSSRIINAGDGINEHPTQGLLDLYTLQEEFGSLKNLNVCIVGNICHSRVALSNIFGLLKFGVNVSVCGPVPFIPGYIEGLGVSVYTDIDNAVKNNDVLNILRVQTERDASALLPSLTEYSRHYCITKERLRLNPKIKILHPGPMNINVEIDYEASVSADSLIFNQVTNGLAVKCALFTLMSKTDF
ncbi:MAG: aspartate carbamoyltransferase catalytic subunit [Ignavibacteria bacterium]|nr:aspartate carbamoyltransferase catalytic subunit [Ignavibacteria bacterium]